MFMSQTVREDPNDVDGVFAFRILGEVTADDMSAMSDYMNEQFDRYDKVSMILIFDQFDGSETGANADWSVIKSRVRAITKVDKYAVVNAPDSAAKMIEGLSKIMPVEARAFDTEQEAWDFIGARALDQKIRN